MLRCRFVNNTVTVIVTLNQWNPPVCTAGRFHHWKPHCFVATHKYFDLYHKYIKAAKGVTVKQKMKVVVCTKCVNKYRHFIHRSCTFLCSKYCNVSNCVKTSSLPHSHRNIYTSQPQCLNHWQMKRMTLMMATVQYSNEKPQLLICMRLLFDLATYAPEPCFREDKPHPACPL